MNYVRVFLFLIGLVIPTFQMTATQTNQPIKAELIQEETTVQPGRPFTVALRLTMEEGWHVYWKNPGDAGLPLKVEWKLPTGLQAGPLKWPFPEKFNLEDLVGFGYEKEVILLAELTPAITMQPGTTVPLEAHLSWLVCSSNTCQPGEATIHLPLQIETHNPPLNEQVLSLFKETRAKLPTSHVLVKTIHKEGIVQLQVPTIDSLKENLLGVDFFPEQTDVIDHSVDPTVALNEDHSTNKYVVNLKGSDEIGVDRKTLKGVLVVRTQQAAGQSIQAYDIDSPIQDEQNDFLMLAEIPQIKKPTLTPLLGSAATPVRPSAQFEGGLGLALVFAFIGGMILNLMPCVLPVMSFKVMSFVKMAGQSRSLTMKHGLMFSVGVVLSFWVLAGAMLMLRTYGHSVGWGFQLQEPLFVIILATILFVFSLSLFGLFEIGMSVASWAGQTEVGSTKQSGYMSSFLSGVLATAVATPCTGPFLGSAVGFAVTLPAFQALLIFTSLALGMCFPYLLLAVFPSFLRFIPKPGPWMETFKQLMGFGLLATVLWLLWVFSAQTNTLSLMCILAGFLCFSIGAWIYGRGSSPLVRKYKRRLSYVFAAVMFIIGSQIMLMPRESWYQDQAKTVTADDDWEPFSLERIAELQKKGIPVLVDFTAKWCLICQANHLVLSSSEVTKQIEEIGMIKMKADWTKNDPIITQELSRFGRTSVPLYVLYGTNQEKEPLILPQILTPDVVIEHIKSAIESELIVLN